MSRAHLYALSARNAVGRRFGATWAYSAAQQDAARVMWNVFRTRYDQATSAALLGCADGECSFLLSARGDRNKVTGEYEAGGAYQWHESRRAMILHNERIDVWAAAADAQAEAVMAEMSEPWSWYKHVEAHLVAAQGLADKMFVLVHELEQSGLPDRDVARRTPMAQYWLGQLAPETAV